MEIFTSRGLRLLLNSQPKVPTITVELYEKWYNLYIVYPDLKHEKLSFPESLLHTPYAFDHLPNPLAVKEYAEKMGYEIDILAYELMIGRWEIDYKDNYPPC